MTTVTLTRHAVERMVEFGIGEDVVTSIATRPSVTRSSTTHGRGEDRIHTSDTHPEYAVVMCGSVVITVLRRLHERWTHDVAAPCGMSPAAVPARPVRAGIDDRVEATPPARPVARRQPAPPSARAAVVSRVVDPDALAAAQVLADGDPRRLVLNPDGSVTVLNQPRTSARR